MVRELRVILFGLWLRLVSLIIRCLGLNVHVLFSLRELWVSIK